MIHLSIMHLLLKHLHLDTVLKFQVPCSLKIEAKVAFASLIFIMLEELFVSFVVFPGSSYSLSDN